MKGLRQESIIKQNDRIITARLNNEVSLLNEHNGMYYALDEIGSVIWDMISEPITLKAIINKLVSEYDITQEECERDVLRFLIEMHKNKNLVYSK